MKFGERLNHAQQADAKATGIAFGWELRSILVARPACIAACERCKDLSVRSEMAVYSPDPVTRQAFRIKTEFEVWSAFKAMALAECCEHLLDYLAHKGTFLLPAECVEPEYCKALLRPDDWTLCEQTGIAFGLTTAGGFLAGCDRCAYVHRVKAEDLFENLADVHKAMRAAMSRAAVQKTCAHYFRWLKIRDAIDAAQPEEVLQ